MLRRPLSFVLHRGIACAMAILWLSGSAAQADNQPASASAKSEPGVLFSTLLPDLPGKRLVAVNLEFDPKAPRHFKAHRHPGSVYVYITRGTVRLGIEGQTARLVHTGESFFELPGSEHLVSENASATQSASLLAVFVADDGAKLTTPDR